MLSVLRSSIWMSELVVVSCANNCRFLSRFGVRLELRVECKQNRLDGVTVLCLLIRHISAVLPTIGDKNYPVSLPCFCRQRGLKRVAQVLGVKIATVPSKDFFRMFFQKHFLEFSFS